MKLRTLLTRAPRMPRHGEPVDRRTVIGDPLHDRGVEAEPFREVAYQQLMRLHANNRKQRRGLRDFEHAGSLLREELGASPAPQTEAISPEDPARPEHSRKANALMLTDDRCF